MTVSSADKSALDTTRAESTRFKSLFSILSLVSYGWKVGKTAEKQGATSIVAWTVKALLYGTVAARRARVPLIWCINDRLAADYFGTAVAFVLGRIAPLATAGLIVNSEATLATVRSRSLPVLVAPPGVELRTTPPAVRQRLATVVMAGRIAPWKGQREFIEAFHSAFADTATTAQIVGGPLFGEDDYYLELEELVRGGPCADRIELVGHVEAVSVGAYLDAADVLVHASVIPEPFGAVVLEGLAAGAAVIATAPGGPAEVITDGVNGLLVPCGDVAALTAALARLRDDPSLVAALSSAAPDRARDYDAAVISPRLTDWVSEVEHHTAAGRTYTVRPADSAATTPTI